MVQTDSRQSENIVGARAGVVDCCAFWSAWLEVYSGGRTGKIPAPWNRVQAPDIPPIFLWGVGDIHCVFNVIINNMAMGYR